MTEHSFRTVVLNSRNRIKRKTLITFSDPSYDIIADFINGELESFHDEICSEFDEMRKKGSQARFSGNRINLAADSDKTLIYEDNDYEMRWCEIRTEELLDLIHEWEQERETE